MSRASVKDFCALEWVPVVVRICQQLADMMSLKKATERKALLSRDGLKIELQPGMGIPADSCVIPGVVWRKDVARRRMRTNICQPKLLLLSGALELECNKLTQLHTAITREPEFLDAAVDRILAVAPDVCVVERSASLYAVERLQKANVTLVCNVPTEDMMSLSANTNTKVAPSVFDVDESYIGTCSEFYILRIKQSKTQDPQNSRLPSPLMVFETDADRSTYAIALRGGSDAELALVREALAFAAFAAHRLQFENAFLRDTLSIAASSAVAYGVEGLSEAVVLESLEHVCKGIVRRSAHKTGVKRSNIACTDSISPHVTSWTADRSHELFKQINEYSRPVYDSVAGSLEQEEEDPQQKVEFETAQRRVSDVSEDVDIVDKATGTKFNAEGTHLIAHCVSHQPFSQVQILSLGPKGSCKKSMVLVEPLLEPDGIALGVADENDSSRPATSVSNELGSLLGDEKDFKRADSEETTERLTHRSSSSMTLSTGCLQEGQTSYTNTWNDWSDVEQLREGGPPCAMSEPQAKEDQPSPLMARKNLGIVGNLRFSASVASRNHRLGLLCEPCHVRSIDSLGGDNLSLSDFLISIAADAPRKCPATKCGGGNSSHHRTFLHGAVRLTISVISLPVERAYPNPTTDIWFWARPKGVTSDPLATVSQTLLSDDAKCLSLGQFLQLMCDTPDLKVFGRLLYLEHVIYFGYGRTVACIHADRICLKTVTTPTPVMNYSLSQQIDWLTTSAEHLVQEVHSVYEVIQKSCVPSLTPTAVGNALDKTKEQIDHECYVRSSLVPELLEEKEKLCEDVRELTDGIRKERTTNDQILERYLQLNQLWRQLGIGVLSWSAIMNDPHHATNLDTELPFEDINLSIGTRISDSIAVDASGDGVLRYRSWKSLNQRKSQDPPISTILKSVSQQDQRHRNDSAEDDDASPSGTWNLDLLSADGQEEFDEMLTMRTPFMAMVDQPFPPSPFLVLDDDPDSASDEALKTNLDGNSMSVPLSPFRSIDLVRSPSIKPVVSDGDAQIRLKPTSSAGNLMDVFDREAQEFMDEIDGELYPARQRSVSLPASPRENTLLNQLDRRLNFQLEDEPFDDGSEPGDDCQASSMLAHLQSFTAMSTQLRPTTPASRTPLPGSEIKLGCRALITMGNDDLVIPVFDAEPTSVVAHVLSSISYHKDLQQSLEFMTHQPMHSRSRTASSSGELEQRTSDPSYSRTSSMNDQRGSRFKSSNPFHIVQRFEDSPPGMSSSHAKFEVTSFFAPQFAKMRARCISGGERSFVMSMSRSRRWKASGGKSNAYFAKTLDGRYVIKSLSKSEKTSFLDQLGPRYFQHIEEQHLRSQDVSLAKVVGLFQVSMKSLSSRGSRTDKGENGMGSTDLGRDWVLDLIVVEDVFYGRRCSSVYDLKGSHRLRYNKEAEKMAGDERGVFLDTNLKKHNILAPPLLVDQRSLDHLAKTLERDTEFLVRNSVMDYSLLVGIDSESNCLVVAIIDYIRQYTWDKRLEYWVKSSGFMGDGSEDPTIISPDSYRKRFMETILGYFTVVPYM